MVYKGPERETYSCAPDCERRITLGDSQGYFTTSLGQTGARSGQAQAALNAAGCIAAAPHCASRHDRG